jgi:microcystin-dependent protein
LKETIMEPTLSEIRVFPYTYAPRGYAVCNGAILNIVQFSALFSLLGSQYGGDGKTTFALPDMRGRIPVGQGMGAGLTPRVMAQQFGTTAETITANNMPPHSHALTCNTATGNDNVPTNKVLAGDSSNVNYYRANPTPSTVAAMGTSTVTSKGGGLTHSNLMPGLALGFFIATTGYYPIHP